MSEYPLRLGSGPLTDGSCPARHPLLTGREDGLSYRDARLSGSPADEMITYLKRVDADCSGVGKRGKGTISAELLRAGRCMVVVAPACRD